MIRVKDEEQPTGTGKEVDWVINDEVQAGGQSQQSQEGSTGWENYRVKGLVSLGGWKGSSSD